MATFPPLLGLLVAISGATSLIYELLFIRALGLHFGTTTPAITTVVATFMLGLGLGNLAFGERADRSARPFALYARIELSIALSALAVSIGLWRGGASLDRLARLCSSAGSFATIAMACVLAALMLVPTTAMGGTLPVLARALSQSHAPGRALGWLYACNTLGAIAGALLPDFALIPRYGMTVTACIAATGNFAIAATVFVVFRREPERSTAHEGEVGAALSRTQLGAIAISACSGFCALGLEVLWSRTLQHWAAALVTSFAILLAVYLTALSCGTLLTRDVADRSRRPLGLASLLLGLTAICIVAP
ncbi:MAG TPA: fused MFS/spermidine synthase, partial [Polyangiales bacterium]|nr:fused MFS/spermidine synthase [Polyangiales bacterium]